GLVAHIVAERERGGPFADFYDFCQRVDPMVLNKRTVESLIKGGAFDSLGHPRQGLLMVFERVIDRTLAGRREREMGIMSLFGDMADGPGSALDERVPIPDEEFDPVQRLAHEKEMLGLYVSSHPLFGVESALRRHADCTIAELREARDGETRWVGGVVTALGRKYTKRGDLMATFCLEDLQSSIEVMVFPRTMLEFGPLLADDAVVCVKGRLDLREEPAKIVCLELKRPDLSPENSRPVQIKPRHRLAVAQRPGPAQGGAPRPPRRPARAGPSRHEGAPPARRVSGRRGQRSGGRVARTARSEWTSDLASSDPGGSAAAHGTKK
ncbi:MAG: hypothetical protein LC713_00825, partial [Actinobacteria bacterium]|nr:hypothetical protein [Actinomycetota bacterium]